MNNNQSAQPIESLDVLVHPFFGMRNRVPYDGFPYNGDFLQREYAKIGAFVREQFSGNMPGHAYAELLEHMWKERIHAIAADPTNALLLVPYASAEVLTPPPLPRDEHIRNLGLFAQRHLGNRCIIGLPSGENIARQEVVKRCTPTVSLHSYGEVSDFCVLDEVYRLMMLLPSHGVKVQHHRHLELCGDRIEGKREAYARFYPQPEAVR